MWGHNIMFALRTKKLSLNDPRYSLLFGALTISKIDRMILNLRGFFQKRDLAVLQSQFIDHSNGHAQSMERTLGMKLSPFLALIIPYKL